MGQLELTDQSQVAVSDVKSLSAELNEWRRGQPYPFKLLLKILRATNKANDYVSQLDSSYRDIFLSELNEVTIQARTFGTSQLNSYLQNRYGQIITEGNTGVSFSPVVYEDRIKEMFDIRFYIDSDFIPGEGNQAQLLTNWQNAMNQIEDQWKNKIE